MNDVAGRGPPQGGPKGGGPRRDGPPPEPTLLVHEEMPLQAGTDLSLLRRLLPYVRPHAFLLVVSLVLMPAAALANLLQPYLLKLAVDAALVQQSAEALLQIVAFFGATIAGEFVARFGQIYTMQLAGNRAMADLRRDVFRHIQRLRVGYFDRTPVGRVVTRVTNDVETLSELFGSGAVTAIADVLMLVGIVGFMLYLDWRLSLVAFAALPPLAIAVELFRRRARDAFRAIRSRLAQLNAYMSEQVQGVAVVQAFGREGRCQEEYRQVNAAYRDANHRSIRYDALLYSVVESISAASVAIALWYAGVRVGVLEGTVASAAYVGTVVAFYEYIQRFFLPIRDLAQKYTIIQSSLASAERIFELLDVREFDAPPRDIGAPPDVSPSAAISFRDVTFAYRPAHPVLHEVSFDVRRGEKVAIVGATGSGKTTVTSLLLRLYEPQDGHVVVDGADVRSMTREELRSRFAVVPQDVFLFAGTVLENVAVGAEHVDEERARDALRRVGALDLVMRREGGLQARVDERGSNFSAGERQLIAFARALYRDPTILVLDEATANIDSETEARLQDAALELLSGRTALVIAHRLSTIRRADRILVFHKGRVVEQGSHAELLSLDGVYARLHRLQFAGEEAAE